MNTILILIIWNSSLTLLIFYLWFLLRRFFPRDKRGLKQLIEDSLYKNVSIEKNIGLLKEGLNKHQENTKKHFQKIGLIKFNPFERLGGEQSYCLALLAENESGIVITFLYTKGGIRVYIKEVIKGKSKDVSFSKEEKEAILKAVKL